MLGFLFKAIAISAVIIFSGMVGGAVIQNRTDNTTSNVLPAQVETTDSLHVPPIVPVVTRSIPYVPYVPPLKFRGYPCTEDCSGHEAGYEWAEENEIENPDDCGGNSDSFIEGCQSYAEEMQEENTDEYYDDYEYDDYEY